MKVSTSSVSKRIAVILILGLSVVLSGCAAEPAQSLRSEGSWARNSPMVDGAAAVYMTLVGGAEADALVAASVPASVAAEVELHETRMMDGMMSMVEVDRIDVPSGQEVQLAPGGLHIMLVDLAAPLVTGDKFEATLTFASGAVLVVEVEVRAD